MRYTTPAAFRQALEERLKQHEQQTGEPLVRLRKRVVFERCMSRLQKEKKSPWVLKGLDKAHQGPIFIVTLAPRSIRRKARAGLFISGGSNAL